MPHRTFLNDTKNPEQTARPWGGRGRQPQLIVYNLPSSLAEYLSAPCQEEAAYVRLLLYRGGGGGGGGNNPHHPRLVA